MDIEEMKDDIKYSVIIPVYNAQRTLERCLNSLLQQERSDIELIVINDGSSDTSAEIIRKFEKEYNSIVAIHQKNAGVSETRNYGLKIARGTYITFVDSDDYVSNNYFEVLDSMDDSDLGIFDSQDIGREANSVEFFSKLEKKVNLSQKLELLLSSRRIMPPWNKRFKNKIIEKHALHFVKEFKMGEDFDFCMSYILHCGTICERNTVLYHVDISDADSLSRKYRPNLYKQMMSVFRNIEHNVSNTKLDNLEKKHFLSLLDYLYIKNTFTCIAEEFKTGKPQYLKERRKYVSICESFKYTIGEGKNYYNVVHWCIRVLVRYNIVFPIYFVTYLVKWNAFRKYTEE